MKRIIIFPFLHEEKIWLNILHREGQFEKKAIEFWGIVPDGYYDRSDDEVYKGDGYTVYLSTSNRMLDCLSSDIFVQSHGNGLPECSEFSESLKKELIVQGAIVYNIDQFSLNEILENEPSKEKAYSVKNFRPLHTSVKEIPIPVIGVGSVYHSYHTAEIMLQMKSVISQYSKILTIYSREGLSGTDIFCISPSDIKNLSFEDKIKYINWYTNKVVEQEHPDIICMEIPGGLVRLNGTILNGGGEYPFIYSQAVRPDYFVCSVLLNFSSKEKIVSLKDALERQYGISQTCFHLSNAFLPSEEIHRGAGHLLSCILENNYTVARSLERLRQGGLNNCYNFLNRDDVIKWGETL